MEGTLLASDLGFPEGPVVMDDGSIVFCDGNTGELLTWRDGAVSRFAVTGGSPWGAVLGSDGAIYVTQGGNVPGSGDESAVCGIQRVRPDGAVELLSAEIDGKTLAAPNDLAFGPDGRLYFTESGTEQDPRVKTPTPGRLFVLDAAGGGEMLLERPDVYPNGIAFDAQGRLYWTESMAHRVCRMDDGAPTTFSQLTDGHVPDGMAFADDGRLFVCTTISGGVTILSPDGEILEEIELGEHATNCIFDGSTLYVTATKVPDLHADDRTGTFWRVETDATGLPLIAGRL
ncbi:MAG TPA: SMP-30/gluconolactonase/LRE family protein [Solirubrobacteraceae bacterium]|nr:SMP-30/gluconolactonase/LRE family protein [Solirubrobacteraceae bacterium]